MKVRRKQIVIWSVLGATTTLLVAAALSLWMLGTPRLKRTIEQRLSDRLGLAVTIEDLSVSLLPRPKIAGAHLVARIPSRPDLPPFLTIQSFWANAGLFSGLRGHVGTVHVDGLEVAVPPDDVRDAMGPTSGHDGSGEIVVD